MSQEELERLAVRGEEIERFLACDAVREVIDGQLAARREAILNLTADQAEVFKRLRAGLEALEELVAGLSCAAALGEEARQQLGAADGKTATGGRVL